MRLPLLRRIHPTARRAIWARSRRLRRGRRFIFAVLHGLLLSFAGLRRLYSPHTSLGGIAVDLLSRLSVPFDYPPSVVCRPQSLSWLSLRRTWPFVRLSRRLSALSRCCAAPPAVCPPPPLLRCPPPACPVFASLCNPPARHSRRVPPCPECTSEGAEAVWICARCVWLRSPSCWGAASSRRVNDRGSLAGGSFSAVTTPVYRGCRLHS